LGIARHEATSPGSLRPPSDLFDTLQKARDYALSGNYALARGCVADALTRLDLLTRDLPSKYMAVDGEKEKTRWNLNDPRSRGRRKQWRTTKSS
jgi:hypothetical protein